MTQNFDEMGPVSYVLEWIKHSPNLNELEISVCSTSDNPEAILKFLDTASCLKRLIDYLKYVAFNDFVSSEAEVLL